MFVLADAPDDVDDLRRSLNQYLLLRSSSNASSNATTASFIAVCRFGSVVSVLVFSLSSRAMRSVDRLSFVDAVCRRATRRESQSRLKISFTREIRGLYGQIVYNMAIGRLRGAPRRRRGGISRRCEPRAPWRRVDEKSQRRSRARRGLGLRF